MVGKTSFFFGIRYKMFERNRPLDGPASRRDRPRAFALAGDTSSHPARASPNHDAGGMRSGQDRCTRRPKFAAR